MNSTVVIRPIGYADTYVLRHAVLWPDKPFDFVTVDDDPDGHHFGAFAADELVAVVSLFVSDQSGRFRKFATHPDWQHQGIGTRLLSHLSAEARRLGAETLWCDARLEAAPFYQRFGLMPQGEVFYKGSVPYTRMSKPLL